LVRAQLFLLKCVTVKTSRFDYDSVHLVFATKQLIPRTTSYILYIHFSEVEFFVILYMLYTHSLISLILCIKIHQHNLFQQITNLIPCPGPHVTSMTRTFSDPLTIEMQSSPSIKQWEKKHIRKSKIRVFFVFLSNFVLLILVFTCPNGAIAYHNICCLCDVNSISVGAVPWCSQDQIRSSDIVALLKPYMHLLRIFESQVCHSQVVASIECHSLCNKVQGKNLVCDANRAMCASIVARKMKHNGTKKNINLQLEHVCMAVKHKETKKKKTHVQYWKSQEIWLS